MGKYKQLEYLYFIRFSDDSCQIHRAMWGQLRRLDFFRGGCLLQSGRKKICNDLGASFFIKVFTSRLREALQSLKMRPRARLPMNLYLRAHDFPQDLHLLSNLYTKTLGSPHFFLKIKIISAPEITL